MNESKKKKNENYEVSSISIESRSLKHDKIFLSFQPVFVSLT